MGGRDFRRGAGESRRICRRPIRPTVRTLIENADPYFRRHFHATDGVAKNGKIDAILAAIRARIGDPANWRWAARDFRGGVPGENRGRSIAHP